MLEAETVCVRQAAAGTLAPVLQTALDSELAFLQALCGLTLDELLAAAGSAAGQAQELDFLPRWETAQLDLPAAYAQRMSEVGRKGYGCLLYTSLPAARVPPIWSPALPQPIWTRCPWWPSPAT